MQCPPSLFSYRVAAIRLAARIAAEPPLSKVLLLTLFLARTAKALRFDHTHQIALTASPSGILATLVGHEVLKEYPMGDEACQMRVVMVAPCMCAWDNSSRLDSLCQVGLEVSFVPFLKLRSLPVSISDEFPATLQSAPTLHPGAGDPIRRRGDAHRVVERDLFPGCDPTHGHEEHGTIKSGVWVTTVVD